MIIISVNGLKLFQTRHNIRMYIGHLT